MLRESKKNWKESREKKNRVLMRRKTNNLSRKALRRRIRKRRIRIC
jgi:hypothetical protein